MENTVTKAAHKVWSAMITETRNRKIPLGHFYARFNFRLHALNIRVNN